MESLSTPFRRSGYTILQCTLAIAYATLMYYREKVWLRLNVLCIISSHRAFARWVRGGSKKFHFHSCMIRTVECEIAYYCACVKGKANVCLWVYIRICVIRFSTILQILAVCSIRYISCSCLDAFNYSVWSAFEKRRTSVGPMPFAADQHTVLCNQSYHSGRPTNKTLQKQMAVRQQAPSRILKTSWKFKINPQQCLQILIYCRWSQNQFVSFNVALIVFASYYLSEGTEGFTGRDVGCDLWS